MINTEDLKFTIEKIDSVYYSLCDVDTLARAEDTPEKLYTCEKCIFREAVDEYNIVCPHNVLLSGEYVIK